MRSRGVTALVLIGVVAAFVSGWFYRSTHRPPMNAARLEAKLASQVCKQVAECQPSVWEDRWHRSFDRCIDEVRLELRQRAGTCTVRPGAGRPCLHNWRDADCAVPWSADRVEVVCPGVYDCR